MKKRNTKLYSYRGAEPDYLPFDLPSEDGALMKGIFYLEDSKLKEIGYEGPYEKPHYDFDNEKLVWENNSYSVVKLTKEEIEVLDRKKIQKDLEERRKDVKYDYFFSQLLSTNVFKKIRYNSSKSMEGILLYAEFLQSFTDMKLCDSKSSLFENCVKILFTSCDLNEEDLKEFQVVAKNNNIDTVIDIPKKEEINRSFFDVKNYKFIPRPPFKSWKFDGEKFIPPAPYPKDGKVYFWDEEKISWIETSS